jgi:hypothetical protein
MKDLPKRGALLVYLSNGKPARQLINPSQQARNVLNKKRFFDFYVL